MKRGRDLEQILTQYTTFVKPAFEEFCLPVLLGSCTCFVGVSGGRRSRVCWGSAALQVVAVGTRVSRAPRSPLYLICLTITSSVFKELKWLLPCRKAPWKPHMAAHICSLLWRSEPGSL